MTEPMRVQPQWELSEYDVKHQALILMANNLANIVERLDRIIELWEKETSRDDNL